MDYPTVSIIMPVRNESAFIKWSLGAVLAQDYLPERLEVVIADGMSDDGTRDIVAALQSTHPNIRLIDNPGRVMPAGANVAIRQAHGEMVVILGGHTMIPADYVRQCVEWLVKENVDCVGGAVDSVGDGYVGEAIAVAMSSIFGVGGSGFRTATENDKPVLTDTVPFGAYRREVFERIGLFNEHMVRHQDYEFNYRLRRSGGRILLLPSLRASYHVRSNLKSLWRQYWQYGIWKGRFLRNYPASLKLRHLLPPLFVLAVLASSLLAIICHVGPWILGVTLSAYMASVLVVLIAVSMDGKLKYVPILPAIFACLHVSWGLGVWLGLLSPKVPDPQFNKT